MALPISYNVNHVLARKVSTLFTLLFVALVVATLAVMLSFSRGINESLQISGDPLNVVVKAKGAESETASSVSPTHLPTLTSLPHLAKLPDGRPIISPETVCFAEAFRLGDKDQTSATILSIRGVDWELAQAAHPGIRIVEGRPFTSAGAREIIVGRAAQQRFQGMNLGDKLHIGYGSDDVYTVVGVYEAVGSDGQTTGGVLECEVWGSGNYVRNSYRRTLYSSIRLRLANGTTPEQTQEVLDRILGPGIEQDAKLEPAYYAELTQQGNFMKWLAGILGVCMGLGAVFAITNTMYGAVAGRLREIGMLRAIGFSRRSIMMAFVIEALVISLAGGLLGCAGALLFNGLKRDVMSETSMTSLAYQISVSPDILIFSLASAVAVGMAGALFPAWRASHATVVNALKTVE